MDLKLKFESVQRTLETTLGDRTADFSFQFQIPQSPIPSQVTFNIYEENGQAYCSGAYQTSGQFSPTFANVATADWSILATIVSICEKIITDATPKT